MLANGFTNAIHIDRKKFVDVHKHSRGLGKIRNMLLKFVRKVYLQHIRKPFLMMDKHL